jgi:16S rRNA (guanine966-N2)-methyltransferase
MIQIIAGDFKGRRLKTPVGDKVRPTAARVREAWFSILQRSIRNARVLDLFAGSGAAGIEALSRGAAGVTFVEHDAGAARVIATNLARTHTGGPGVAVVREDALRWLQRAGAATGSFDIAIVDPPYDRPALLVEALEALGPHLAAGARVVAKHFWRDAPPATVGLLASERERRFGDTALTFYRRQEDR